MHKKVNKTVIVFLLRSIKLVTINNDHHRDPNAEDKANEEASNRMNMSGTVEECTERAQRGTTMHKVSSDVIFSAASEWSGVEWRRSEEGREGGSDLFEMLSVGRTTATGRGP